MSSYTIDMFKILECKHSEKKKRHPIFQLFISMTTRELNQNILVFPTWFNPLPNLTVECKKCETYFVYNL